MARPVDRDLDEVRARLADWTSGRIARNAPVEITDLAMPASTGYSGETFLFRAHWADGEQRLVARLKPTGHSVFNSFDFANEYRAIDALLIGLSRRKSAVRRQWTAIGAASVVLITVVAAIQTTRNATQRCGFPG